MTEKEFERIEKFLTENNMFPDIQVDDDLVCLEIKRGDWKHDHLYCNHLMSRLGYELLREVVTEQDGSDNYSSQHIYRKEIRE